MSKTYSAKPSDITRKWHVVDASETTLGRLASAIAVKLIGKDKAIYTPHIDCGDYVIVINSDKLKYTGNKATDKIYYRHSQYPGSLKSKSLSEMIEADSTKVIELAVKNMLPKNKLSASRTARLKVYKDEKHGHDAQQPAELKISGDSK